MMGCCKYLSVVKASVFMGIFLSPVCHADKSAPYPVANSEFTPVVGIDDWGARESLGQPISLVWTNAISMELLPDSTKKIMVVASRNTRYTHSVVFGVALVDSFFGVMPAVVSGEVKKHQVLIGRGGRWGVSYLSPEQKALWKDYDDYPRELLPDLTDPKVAQNPTITQEALIYAAPDPQSANIELCFPKAGRYALEFAGKPKLKSPLVLEIKAPLEGEPASAGAKDADIREAIHFFAICPYARSDAFFDKLFGGEPVKENGKNISFATVREKLVPLLAKLTAAQKICPAWEKPYLQVAELNLRRMGDFDLLKKDPKKLADYDRQFAVLIAAQKDQPFSRWIWSHRLDMWLMVGNKKKAEALFAEFIRQVPEKLRPWWTKVYWVNKNYLVYPGFSSKEELERGPATMDANVKVKRDARFPTDEQAAVQARQREAQNRREEEEYRQWEYENPADAAHLRYRRLPASERQQHRTLQERNAAELKIRQQIMQEAARWKAGKEKNKSKP